ncbi:Facilitated glucose transporter protein 1 [Aphelenchoides bicaudatus]|nr:Facilitated glucose transporter protein 1 [Aphelenchoides bicaudatus]
MAADEADTKKNNSALSSISLGLSLKEEQIVFNSRSVNFRLAFSVIVVAFGSSFQFGYNIGVVNAPSEHIQNWINNSHTHLFGHQPEKPQLTAIFSTAVALFSLGALVGGLMIGYVSDKFGRKRSLHYNNILSVLAGILFVVAYYVNCYPIFHVARFIIGVNAGLSSGLVPMFLTELSPVRLRGAFGSISQLVVTISICVAQVLGLRFIFGTADRWICMFGFILLPSILQIVGLFFVPESPKWTLIFGNDRNQALTDLKKFRKSQELAKLELKALEHEKSKSENRESFSIKELFTTHSLRWPLTIIILLMAFPTT